MSLLIEKEHIDEAREAIKVSGAEYHDIVPLEGQMKAHRDKYC